jgi:type IV secretory pathway VirB2 component (pilin)
LEILLQFFFVIQCCMHLLFGSLDLGLWFFWIVLLLKK